MTRTLPFLFTLALTALSTNSLFATADYTFQTSPSSKQILSANQGLAVRWEVRPGNSPDSNSPAPIMLTVSLGYRDASGNPQLLYPPLNGVESNVPLQDKFYTWPKIDFSIFTANKEGLPALDTSSQFFIVLGDQATGYRSNGQIFSIVGSPGAAAAPATPAPAPVAPTAPTARPSGAAAKPSTPSGTASQQTSATSPTGGNSNNDVSSPQTQPTFSGAPQHSVSLIPLMAFGGALICMIHI